MVSSQPVTPENKYGKKRVTRSIAWKLMERLSFLAVTLIMNFILARLLEPEAFGLIALVNVFITFSSIFVSGGLSNALIQKVDADETDFSSVFWLNLGVSAVLYLLIFIFAPIMSNAMGYPALSPVLRVLGIKLFFAAFNAIQTAFISKNMMFRPYFFSTLVARVLSAIFGVLLAFLGYGVWALVAQSISMLVIEVFVLFFIVRWRPKIIFIWQRAKNIYSFAVKLMATSLIEITNQQVRSVVIGVKFSSVDLAYYDKGILLPNSFVTNISSSLSSVMFPVVSAQQHEVPKVSSTLRRWIGLFCYTTFPILFGMIITADPLIPLFFSDKWLPSVPFFRIACAAFLVWAIEVPIKETLKALGFATACLRIQMIKTGVALLSLACAATISVFAVTLTTLLVNLISFLLSMYYARKHINYSWKNLFSDVHQTLILSAIMCLSIYFIPNLFTSRLLILLAQVVIAVIVYVAASIIIKNRHFSTLKKLLLVLVSSKKEEGSLFP
ncbi:MAG: lipopolysaccharide biosynthesis protein [Clostridiaceae bacterium]|nr:lipopolysaccharide biosynthesis protein [Clostridiaceae bacterium]